MVHNDADEVEDKRVTEFGIGLQGPSITSTPQVQDSVSGLAVSRDK